MSDGPTLKESRTAASPELEKLVEVIERLHRDHTVSFIAAGAEKIYAYGGGGYIAIVSDRVFDGVVDVETPAAKFKIERDEAGLIKAVSASGGEEPSSQDIAAAADGFEQYYSRRIGTV